MHLGGERQYEHKVSCLRTQHRVQRLSFSSAPLHPSKLLTIFHLNEEAWAFYNPPEVKKLKLLRRLSDTGNLLEIKQLNSVINIISVA